MQESQFLGKNLEHGYQKQYNENDGFNMEEFLEQYTNGNKKIDADNLEVYQRDMFSQQKNTILNNTYDLINVAAKIFEISAEDIYTET